MSNENNRENMDNQQPENLTNLTGAKKENSANKIEMQDSKLRETGSFEKVNQQNTNEKNTGVAIKNIESESLNSLLVYDSDSSASSEMMKLNLDWQVRDGSDESSTSSSSSSSSEEDSESSSEDEDDQEEADLEQSENRGAIRKVATSKIDGEMPLELLPPVPDLSKLSISVEDENFVHMGSVLGIVDKLVTVAAIPNTPAYDLDTLLFLDNGKRPLGFVFDVLGQVTSPIYAIRFNTVEDIKNLQIQIGTKVYSAPTSKHTQYVFLQQLLKMKGSDASWTEDHEVPSEFADFSDDENECYQRFGNKRLSPHVKRTHSSDNYKKFETTMNRKNILNTKFNKYMDSYKQARLNKIKSKRPQAPHINTSMPVFDPSVPPPNLAFHHQPAAGSVQVLPPEYVGMVYDPVSGSENNNSGMSHSQEPDITSKLALPSGSASPPVLWASRRKTGLHLRSGGDDCRMPAEGGIPSSESAHRDRLQRHNNHAGHGGHCYDPEYARMESWLDEHPDFVQDYFLRKATRQVVDSWLVSHATPTSSSVELASPTHNQSRAGSGATTPVRKISAHEFERGGLLKPMISTIDGQPTFLTGSAENQVTGGANSPTPGRRQRRSRHELRHLDEKELIFELVKDICNELEVRSLCHKILQNVSTLLHADRGSLFLVQGEKGGGCTPQPPGQAPRGRCLVSKLFDVCSKSTLTEMEKKEEIRIPWGTGIVGYVAESGEPVNIPDAYQDDRFNHDIDALTGYRTKTLLCMPIKDTNGDVIGVAQVINKVGDYPFTKLDEEVFASYLQFCGIGLRNAHLYEKSQLEVKRNQVLLDLARMIFEEQSTIEHVVFRILTHTQSLIQCQRVQVLLVHQGSKISFSRVFDFEATDLNGEEGESRTSPFESRFPINVGITGYVATTGETVNIPIAEEDERFDHSVDEGTSFRHKTILCMPIKNSSGQIIGVIQLINKFNDLLFTKNDENFVEAFAIFCGMGIHNTHMYERAVVAIAKQSVTLEVLSYHATSSMEDAHRLRTLRVPSAAHFRLHDFAFDDINMEDDETLTACIRMFLDLDLVERFHMDYEVLCRWLLSVKKNYRNVTYHNWRHAFNVAQMMFSILTATQWWNVFGEIECLSLMIACLCHDLDHRGTNNSFQIKASSPLAQLYSTSTMEHHHFDQCIMILNSPGNQLLANISSEEYSRVIRVLEEAILSTDLAVYFRKRGAFFNVIRDRPCWSLDEHRELLRAMLMTVCDLAAITKPWEVEKRVAELVSSEFFEQGDIEREKLNITPIDIMNREKEDQLPLMQVGFIDSICLPIYEAFSRLSPHLEPLVEGVRKNRVNWLEIAAAQSLIPAEGERDSNDNLSKPNTPESNPNASPITD